MQLIAVALLLFAGHRDLFKYVERPPRPVVKKHQPVQTVVVPQPVPAKKENPLPPTEPAPPQFPYRCIGTFGPAWDPFAVFDAGGAIINVRAGEVIDGKFIVRAIGIESVTIGVEGYPDRRIAIGAAR